VLKLIKMKKNPTTKQLIDGGAFAHVRCTVKNLSGFSVFYFTMNVKYAGDKKFIEVYVCPNLST